MPLAHIPQFNTAKIATSYYFLFFDKENYLEWFICSIANRVMKRKSKTE